MYPQSGRKILLAIRFAASPAAGMVPPSSGVSLPLFNSVSQAHPEVKLTVGFKHHSLLYIKSLQNSVAALVITLYFPYLQEKLRSSDVGNSGRFA